MRTTTLALAASLSLALTGAAFAQTAAGGGSAEGNMNNPGSVKSNGEKGMERSTGSATEGSKMAPDSTGSMNNVTPGAPGGSNSGNAATGSGAAPTGK